VVAFDHALRRLGHAKRVLVIGAHPDDEDTELLALVSQGMGGEAAYLSLSRGEGGRTSSTFRIVPVDLGPGSLTGIIRAEML